MIPNADDTFNTEEIKPIFSQLLMTLVHQVDHQTTVLFDLLLYAAVSNLSISKSCQHFPMAPSDKTVMKKLRGLFDDCDDAERKINRILHQTLPQKLQKRKRMTLAVDYHQVPFYGTIEAEQVQPLRSKRKQGTSKFYTFATVCVCMRNVRYTLAIFAVKKGETTLDVMKKVMKALRVAKIQPTLLLLDGEFYASRTMGYLIRKKIRFLIPARRSGKYPDENSDGTETNRFYGLAPGWYYYTLNKKKQYNKQKLRVTFKMCVSFKYEKKKDGKRERKMVLLAGWGMEHLSPDWVRELYRRRFGIETSYRQKNEAKIKTCVKDGLLRLLFFSVSMLVRQIWVGVHDEVLSTTRQGRRVLNSHLMTLQDLCEGIRRAIEKANVISFEKTVESETKERLNKFFSQVGRMNIPTPAG